VHLVVTPPVGCGCVPHGNGQRAGRGGRSWEAGQRRYGARGEVAACNRLCEFVEVMQELLSVS
jgi:hypothetical protein